MERLTDVQDGFNVVFGDGFVDLCQGNPTDPYTTVGWGRFGRVIMRDGEVEKSDNSVKDASVEFCRQFRIHWNIG